MNQNAIETFDRYLRARYPIIGIVSHEEDRVLQTLEVIASKRNRTLATWTITRGLQNVPGVDAESTADIIAALTVISERQKSPDEPIIYVLQDAHHYLNDPVVMRHLRDISLDFLSCKDTLVMLSPALTVPADLEKSMVLVDWPLPDEQELAVILKQAENDLPSHIPVKLNGNREKVVQALRGLTAFEAASVLSSAAAGMGELGDSALKVIITEKAQIIRKSGVLEFIDTSVSMGEVGGLSNLKEYSAIARTSFSAEAKKAGVDAPKGVLLVGVPGTGKSLMAKAIAANSLPLLRMDFGAIMGGVVGQSEANVRQALKVAEAVAPCVLWIDEVEKALGGVESSNQSDGGTLTRVFGTFLTWMQETTSPVYVVATANDIRAMKPEFLRRFDDIFWVDLPDATARLQIINVHLSKRGYKINDLTEGDVTQIVDATYGFSGAEIEKAVKTAIKHAFFQKAPLTGKELLQAASQIVPIGVTMSDKIADLRAWATNRALPAGDPIEAKAVTRAPKNRMSDL